MTSPPSPQPPAGQDWLLLTESPLDAGVALEWIGRAACGGEVAFVGVVRDHAEGRSGVTAVDYEAYEDQILPRMAELVAAARDRVPGLGAVCVWHRTGRLVVGEASVVVAVSSAHRAQAFEACRFVIDTLKEALPIWKHEHFEGGSGWSPAAHPVRPVAR
ncbi:MAG: molybdenum cofactor biosynthesis protein MoaE [Acidimicrobiales bacterium]